MLKMRFPLIMILFFLTMLAAAQSPVEQPLIRVPDINGRATSLIKPAFPESAAKIGVDGSTLTLKVVVDENGNVLSALCSLACPSVLKDAAELAAFTSKFKPLEVNGRAVRYE